MNEHMLRLNAKGNSGHFRAPLRVVPSPAMVPSQVDSVDQFKVTERGKE